MIDGAIYGKLLFEVFEVYCYQLLSLTIFGRSIVLKNDLLLLEVLLSITIIDYIWQIYCSEGWLTIVEGVTIKYYHGLDW